MFESKFSTDDAILSQPCWALVMINLNSSNILTFTIRGVMNCCFLSLQYLVISDLMNHIYENFYFNV